MGKITYCPHKKPVYYWFILSDDKVLLRTSMFLNTIVGLKQTHKQVPKNPSMCPKFLIDPIAFFTNDKHWSICFGIQSSVQHLLTGINNNCTSFLPPIERMPICGILLNLMTEATLHRLADIEPQFAWDMRKDKLLNNSPTNIFPSAPEITCKRQRKRIALWSAIGPWSP